MILESAPTWSDLFLPYAWHAAGAAACACAYFFSRAIVRGDDPKAKKRAE